MSGLQILRFQSAVDVRNCFQNYGAIWWQHFQFIFGDNILKMRQGMPNLLCMVVDIVSRFRRFISNLSIFSFRRVRSGKVTNLRFIFFFVIPKRHFQFMNEPRYCVGRSPYHLDFFKKIVFKRPRSSRNFCTAIFLFKRFRRVFNWVCNCWFIIMAIWKTRCCFIWKQKPGIVILSWCDKLFFREFAQILNHHWKHSLSVAWTQLWASKLFTAGEKYVAFCIFA